MILSSAPSNNSPPPLPLPQPTIDEEIDNLTQIELRRRRQSFFFLLFFFLIIRLWLQVLLTGDSGGLLPFCVFLTVIWSRIHQQRRLEDEELQSQWQRVLGRQLENPHEVTGGASTDAADLRGIPFQLQLALAMLESQRMMQAVMENGNMPLPSDQSGRGVSDEVRSQWKHFTFGDLNNNNRSFREDATNEVAVEEVGEGNRERSSGLVYSIFHRAFAARRRPSENRSTANATSENGCDISSLPRRRDQYASLKEIQEGEMNELYLSTAEDSEAAAHNSALESARQPLSDTECDIVIDGKQEEITAQEEVSCSICLEPYHRGDAVVELPCSHLYHNECILAWTSNSVKCPLCNFDLESGAPNIV